jgi:hypothetical protein
VIVRIVDISSGSCFVPIDETEPEFLHAIVHPCSEPHTLEQIHIFSFERALGTPYPGEGTLDRFADERCWLAFIDYVGRRDADSIYNYAYLTMTETAWNGGERRIACALGADNQSMIEGSARDTNR